VVHSADRPGGCTGYLEAFEPDFVVTGTGIDPTKYGVASSISFPLASMSTKDGLRTRGMTAMPIYRWRHEQELRFVQRHAVPLRLPIPKQPHLALWSAAAFGSFPSGELGVLKDAYRELGAEEEEVRQDTYLNTLLFAYSPLNFANLDLERTSYSRHERTYMVLNPRDPLDVIDFWNLRALGWDVVSMPIAWASALAPRMVETGGPRGTHLLKARSVDIEAFTAVANSIKTFAVLKYVALLKEALQFGQLTRVHDVAECAPTSCVPCERPFRQVLELIPTKPNGRAARQIREDDLGQALERSNKIRQPALEQLRPQNRRSVPVKRRSYCHEHLDALPNASHRLIKRQVCRAVTTSWAKERRADHAITALRRHVDTLCSELNGR